MKSLTTIYDEEKIYDYINRYDECPFKLSNNYYLLYSEDSDRFENNYCLLTMKCDDKSKILSFITLNLDCASIYNNNNIVDRFIDKLIIFLEEIINPYKDIYKKCKNSDDYDDIDEDNFENQITNNKMKKVIDDDTKSFISFNFNDDCDAFILINNYKIRVLKLEWDDTIERIKKISKLIDCFKDLKKKGGIIK